MSFSYAQPSWDPKEAFKTTNASDYTDKQKELRDDRRKPRAEPRDHLWLYGFENTAQMAQRTGFGGEPRRFKKSVEGTMITTNRLDFSASGFQPQARPTDPAGRPTPSNRTGFQYSSQRLVDVLESEPDHTFYGHATNIFLPPSEQSKRTGLQTWSDFPEKDAQHETFKERDAELMRNKTKACLTVPIAGK